MRIERPKPSPEQIRRFSDQVAETVDARGVDGRVCGADCTIVCPQCGSTACQCRCTPGCPEAPATLSSDLETYPIEPAAVPLVYEMRRLGMFRPCWSCEGHLDPKGGLWKLPAVWFYCESLVHVRLLGTGLSRLSTSGTLKAKWHLVFTFSDPDNIETAFSLEPKQPIDEGIGLTELRADLAAIARALQGLMTRGGTGPESFRAGDVLSLAAERTSAAHTLDPKEFGALAGNPRGEIRGRMSGAGYHAQIAIPDFGEKIVRYYAAQTGGGLPAACARSQILFDLAQFGLVITFDSPVEVAVHDTAMRLDDELRALVGWFGPVILKNAMVDHTVRGMFHRNIFPPLRFHVDRGPTMPNQYSCFTRDPLDAEQRGPRASSTLFIANILAWLETVRNGTEGAAPGVKPSYDLFAGQDLAPLFGNVILEQPWLAPAGTGEIAVLDNRTALHATWHKDGRTPGYRIGARYLT